MSRVQGGASGVMWRGGSRVEGGATRVEGSGRERLERREGRDEVKRSAGRVVPKRKKPDQADKHDPLASERHVDTSSIPPSTSSVTPVTGSPPRKRKKNEYKTRKWRTTNPVTMVPTDRSGGNVRKSAAGVQRIDEKDINTTIRVPEVQRTGERAAETATRQLAQELLMEGRMPLLVPAKRRWEKDEQITLPGGIPWSPKDSNTWSSENKMYHTLETFKKVTGQQVHNDRDLLDELGMLLLPDTAFPKATDEAQEARDHVFAVVKRVAAGKDSSPQAVRLVQQLSSLPRPTGVVAEVVKLMREVPLRIA